MNNFKILAVLIILVITLSSIIALMAVTLIPTTDNYDTIFLMLGIVIAAVATGIGLFLTWRDRKDAAKQRMEELVQTYSNELREISNQELGLKTKQECALYAEQYLDTVEKISTLNKLKIFNDNTMKYFENNFTYAIDLWWWYNLNVHGIDADTQDEIWKIAEDDSLEKAGFLKEYGIPKPKKNKQEYVPPIEIKDFISESKFDKMTDEEKEKAQTELKDNLEILTPEEIVVLTELWYKINPKSMPKDYWFKNFYSDEKFLDVNISGLGREEKIILKTVLKGDIDTDLEYFFDEDHRNEIKKIKGKENQLKKKIKIFDRFMAFRNYLTQDRWPDLRNYMSSNDFTDFAYNFRGIGGRDNSEENWRVLPDIMYYDYQNIPDEDGLSKSEFVEIIRPYADILSKFVEQEKSNTKPEQFEVYAEQYLETLEQIATLYRRKIIPTKASEYFENKFSYGCNLWDWYHDIVLKFSDKLDHALWATSTDIKLKDVFSKKELSTKTDKAKQQGKDTEFDKKTFEEFLKSYSNNGSTDPFDRFIKEDPDIWKLIELAVKSEKKRLELKKIDATERKEKESDQTSEKYKDADKDITSVTTDLKKILNSNLEKKATDHRKECLRLFGIEKVKADKLSAKLSKINNNVGDKEPNTLQEKEIKKITAALTAAKKAMEATIEDQNGQDAGFIKKDTNGNYYDLKSIMAKNSDKKILSEKLEEQYGKYYDDSVMALMRLFVINYLDNERWEDFRWWCKNTENGKKEITPFQDDKDEGLILPKKMWDAYYP